MAKHKTLWKYRAWVTSPITGISHGCEEEFTTTHEDPFRALAVAYGRAARALSPNPAKGEGLRVEKVELIVAGWMQDLVDPPETEKGQPSP